MWPTQNHLVFNIFEFTSLKRPNARNHEAKKLESGQSTPFLTRKRYSKRITGISALTKKGMLIAWQCHAISMPWHGRKYNLEPFLLCDIFSIFSWYRLIDVMDNIQ